MGTLSGQKFDQTKYEQVKYNMLKNLKKLINRYGPDAEKVIHGRALKTALNSTEMKENRIREIIKNSLQNPKAADLNKDNELSDYEEKRGAAIEKNIKKQDLKEFGLEEVDTLALTFKDPNEFESAKEHFKFNSDFDPFEISDEFKTFYFQVQDQADANSTESYLNQELIEKTGLEDYYFSKETSPLNLDEDLDLGHEDNEPHMLKADLYKIGKYAMELYQMVDKFEGQGEVDFPHWWQAKIIKAASMISSAKHYLEFELKEPQVDAMVDVASSEDMIDEKLTVKTPMKKYIKDFAKSDAPQFKGKSKEKKRQMAVAAKLSAENPTEGLAEIILNKLKNR